MSYALYLPPDYDPEPAWPVILAFDPGGYGSIPVERLRAAADRYGYIVAGSNDSRNYTSWEFQLSAAGAMWRDVATRFSIDPKRVYTTGFSGGARVATEVALRTGAVAGVFAHGGSFRERDAVEGPIPFVFVGASGLTDMNHREMQQTQRALVGREIAARHLVFDGPHQWAPAEVCTTAVAWFELQAIRAGLREKKPGELEALHREALVGARAREESGDAIGALDDLEQALRDFDGLVDLAETGARVARLSADPEVKRGLQSNRRWIRHEDRERGRLAATMRRMESAGADRSGRDAGLRELRRQIVAIEADAASTEGARREAGRRLLTFVSSVGYERGVVAYQDDRLERAALFFEIALQAAPGSVGLHLRLAAAQARLERPAEALASLTRAVELGLTDAARLRDEPAFEAFAGDARFAALLARIEASPD